MYSKLLSLSQRKYFFLLVSLLLLVSIYCFITPLVISIDSIYGFLAYKGSLLSHSFNMVTEVSADNVNINEHIFQSWWSPGQWIYPGILNYFLGLRLGVASIIVTILFAVAGLWGYYRVFLHFAFPLKIILASLILLACSSTFYYSYIIYQGGEILEFGTFPWFLLYILRIKKITPKISLLIIGLFILCFIAKTTLLLYCFIILVYKVFQLYLDDHNQKEKQGFVKNSLLLILPAALCILFIKLFFISRGPHITMGDEVNISPENILNPLSSPLNAIFSIQQWTGRIGKKIFASEYSIQANIFFISVYVVLLLTLLISAIKIFKEKKILNEYKNLLLFLYMGLSVFFIIAYCLDARIDHSSRHFKLMGFLFIPALLMILYKYLSSLFVELLILLVCLVAITDIVYLKKKWTANRYISANYFYRNFDNLQKIDSLDETSYRKLIAFDRNQSFKSNNQTIFFIESNADIAMDIHHQCIMQEPGTDIFSKIYHGKGPLILFCVIKQPDSETSGILKKKFPDYGEFQLIDETERYSFYIAK
jgi:hypothetical protein